MGKFKIFKKIYLSDRQYDNGDREWVKWKSFIKHELKIKEIWWTADFNLSYTWEWGIPWQQERKKRYCDRCWRCFNEEIEQKNIKVVHDRNIYDVKNGKEERSKAYNYAATAIEKNLKKYPSIQVVIDLHRDGVNESTKLVTRQNGKRMAQIMFFNGMSRTATNGNIKYLKNPNKQTNLAFSLQLQAQAALEIPWIYTKIYVKGYRYNLHYRGRSLLVEVGAQNNTLSEAKASMSLLAELLNNVLY